MQELLNYQPLPTGVRLKKSRIEGIGLFTQQPYPALTNLGVSHVLLERHPIGDGVVGDFIIRTPLGGFINHSVEPNCEVRFEHNLWTLHTTKKIRAGLELTINYFDCPEITSIPSI